MKLFVVREFIPLVQYHQCCKFVGQKSVVCQMQVFQ